MLTQSHAFETNRKLWNQWTALHLKSKFYDVESFKAGRDSLKDIENPLLGDVKGKDLLHLQCHFGQDTLSLARRGANVTGLDISDAAINAAKQLSEEMQLPARWIQANVLDTLKHIEPNSFDIVFTSYGTILWLPELKPWAEAIAGALRPGGKFVFVDFHPVWMMFDTESEFPEPVYNYFNSGAIEEIATGSYADRQAMSQNPTVSWNHGLSSMFTSLLEAGLTIQHFGEYNWSPYSCFVGLSESENEPGRFRFQGRRAYLPLVCSVVAGK